MPQTSNAFVATASTPSIRQRHLWWGDQTRSGTHTRHATRIVGGSTARPLATHTSHGHRDPGLIEVKRVNQVPMVSSIDPVGMNGCSSSALRFRATLDTSKHPGLHDVMAKSGSGQHEWSRGMRQYCVDALNENEAAGWAGAFSN
jgi:hypothetical protein